MPRYNQFHRLLRRNQYDRTKKQPKCVDTIISMSISRPLLLNTREKQPLNAMNRTAIKTFEIFTPAKLSFLNENCQTENMEIFLYKLIYHLYFHFDDMLAVHFCFVCPTYYQACMLTACEYTFHAQKQGVNDGEMRWREHNNNVYTVQPLICIIYGYITDVHSRYSDTGIKCK